MDEVLAICSEPHIQQVHGGWQKCHPGHSFGPLFRGTYIFHYIKNGHGVFQIDNREYHLGAGDVFCIMPGFLVYYEADKTDPWEYEWIGFAGDGISAFLAAVGITEDSPVFSADEGFILALERFLAAYDTDNHAHTLLTSRVYEVLYSLTKEPASDKGGPLGLRYIDRARDYLWCFLHQNITVSALADYVGVNRSYLTGLFKKHLGVSPKEYILTLKMKQACRHLRDTEYSVSQIANALGYEDLFVFSRAFKKVIGVSPTAYRKALKGLS